jgi:probable HAF family extracellular repeat protein
VQSIGKSAFAALLAFSFSNFALAAPQYSLVNITYGAPAGTTFIYGTDINDAGTVVGYGGNFGNSYVFTYDGQFHKLNTNYAGAYAINGSGKIAGHVSNGLYSPSQAATFDKNGLVQALGTFGGHSAGLADINATGNSTGTITGLDGNSRAFLYNGAMQDIGTLGGKTAVGNGIDDSNRVVGVSTNAAEIRHAFLYDGAMHDLGTLGGAGTESVARGTSSSGLVVGWSTNNSGDTHAFLYDGTMRSLGTLGGGWSDANAVNNAGQVVGASDGRAFLFEGSTLYDLNSLLIDNFNGVTLRSAIGINNKGQIVAHGLNGGVFLLSVVPTAVPVPATAWLFGSGLLGLAGVVGRKQRTN